MQKHVQGDTCCIKWQLGKNIYSFFIQKGHKKKLLKKKLKKKKEITNRDCHWEQGEGMVGWKFFHCSPLAFSKNCELWEYIIDKKTYKTKQNIAWCRKLAIYVMKSKLLSLVNKTL